MDSTIPDLGYIAGKKSLPLRFYTFTDQVNHQTLRLDPLSGQAHFIEEKDSFLGHSSFRVDDFVSADFHNGRPPKKGSLEWEKALRLYKGAIGFLARYEQRLLIEPDPSQNTEVINLFQPIGNSPSIQPQMIKKNEPYALFTNGGEYYHSALFVSSDSIHESDEALTIPIKSGTLVYASLHTDQKKRIIQTPPGNGTNGHGQTLLVKKEFPFKLVEINPNAQEKLYALANTPWSTPRIVCPLPDYDPWEGKEYQLDLKFPIETFQNRGSIIKQRAERAPVHEPLELVPG